MAALELSGEERKHSERCRKEGCRKAWEAFKVSKVGDRETVIAVKNAVARCIKDEGDRPKGR